MSRKTIEVEEHRELANVATDAIIELGKMVNPKVKSLEDALRLVDSEIMVGAEQTCKMITAALFLRGDGE